MKKLVSLVVSLGLLALIYWKIDIRSLEDVFTKCDPLWMTLSLGMVVPLTLLTAWRLVQLMPSGSHMSFLESNRLILVASVLNMILPSKMGDIAKAWFMRDKANMSRSLALSLVVFEKSCDMLSLLLWCVFGLLLYPKKDLLFFSMLGGVIILLVLGLLLLGSRDFAAFFFQMGEKFAPGKLKAKFAKLAPSWAEMHTFFWASPSRLALIAGTSVFIWFLHLLQIWMFTLALRTDVPFLANLALAPLGILAGLLPLTFAGVGTRDAAMIQFYAPYMNEATGAVLGILCTARYILPALGGIPFAAEALRTVRAQQASGDGSEPRL